MARRSIRQRRRVIIYIVVMWWQLIQQAICLLMDSVSSRTIECDDDDQVPRPLPHDREVYRRGFLFNTTRTNDVNLDKFCALLQLKQASGFGWDEPRQSHPKASGLNNKPLPFWDDLCFVFGAEMATGADAVQPGDAASKVHSHGGISSFVGVDVEQVDSYTIPSNDHNAVMEDLINQGIDVHATSLKDVEAEITSKNAAAKGKQSGTSSGSKRSRQLFTEDDRARIASTMATASDNIARIADSYCIEGELAVRRQSLYQELSSFPDLNQSQVRMIMRHLNRDDGDATTYFQLPSREEKVAFVWSF